MRRGGPWAAHLAVAVFVLLWTLPLLGLVVTSLRDRDQIAASGWWTAFSGVTLTRTFRTPPGGEGAQPGGRYALAGNALEGGGRVEAFGIDARRPAAFHPGAVADLGKGATLTVQADGAYSLTAPHGLAAPQGQRIFLTATVGPSPTLQNYADVLAATGIARSLLNSAIVAVPSTLFPVGLAVFAAYALAWMPFAGRRLVLAAVLGLMAVPLQVALIPLLKVHNAAGQALGLDPKGFVGVWLAHTGFGLPLAIYLIRNAMAALPREVIDSARLDGASDLAILTRIVLPLAAPAIAGFAVFQFIWTWNDLLVALVFLGPQGDRLVLTGRLLNLVGTHGGQWDILAASACVSVAVPVAVFLAFQRLLVRGLLSGVAD
ncbi:carbohydrate ABC transporter permease [Albidovulum sediminis]|uniref:Carbohydrate ABC transporter permease n=1 Tax=Albidovulum sediminis TaxID=3066345 RepID=A0ABT2NIH5_9RHOB|nr:carbohydrate ABC transporter permease [Defluviimonas sediminis]MCT8328719.1 carbohydrate ABC transporter permease [Defluviimonas sediminis]